MTIRKKILNIIPKKIKKIIAWILYLIFHLQKNFFSYELFDRVFLFASIKINKLDTCKAIIDNHPNSLYFSRIKLELKKLAIFGKDYTDFRIDYKSGDYQAILNLNKDLIKKFPNDYLLHDRMARNYAAGGYRNKARFHFNQSLKLQRKKMLNIGQYGLIFMVGTHRSGSGFAANGIMEGLKIKNISEKYTFIDTPYHGDIMFPDYLGSPYFIPMENGFAGRHANASKDNLWAVDHITDKTIVNIRDPRQILISWVHYMEYLRFSGNYASLIEYRIPDCYFDWPDEKKFDWQIDHYFAKEIINWIKSWVEAEKNPEFLSEILFTHHEILATDPKLYFNQILDFYSIPKNIFSYPKKPKFKEKTHLRKGLTNEWQRVLSKVQIKRINDEIPNQCFNKFNWIEE